MKQLVRWLLVGLLSASCGGTVESDAETVVLCVWDSVDVRELKACGAKFDSTPVLTQLALDGGLVEEFVAPSWSASAAFGSLLTGALPSEHGLRSIHELGAHRLRAEPRTLAEDLKSQGWRTLASVSQAHFGLGDLNRGFDVWHAPPIESPRKTRDAARVIDATLADLDAALASDENVFLVLHFGDLRGRGWEALDPSRETLEAFLGDWRGKGGVIDEVFAATDAEESLGRRMAKTLLRRTDDPRRTQMMRALYATALGKLDSALGDVQAKLRSAGRSSKATILVAGCAAGKNEGSEPGARERTFMVRSGQSDLLKEYVKARSATPVAVSERRRAIDLRLNSEAFDGLNVTVTSPTGRVSLNEQGEMKDRAPAEDRCEFVLVNQERARLGLVGAGGDFFLRLQHPRLFSLTPEGLSFGPTTMAKSDLPVMLASNSPDWPENALAGPLLDIQSVGGRRMSGTFLGKISDRVELLIESFPPDPAWATDVDVESGGVFPHEQRPGAIWIRGNGTLRFELPPRSPSDRLGLVVRFNSDRIPGSRIRYLKRTFTAPDLLEFGVSAGAWLDATRLGEKGPLFAPKIGIQMLDDQPLPAEIRLPSISELEYLGKLDATE